MLHISFLITDIDYSATFHTLFPYILEKCARVGSPNLLLRLFLELNGDAEPVLNRLVSLLDEGERQMILCRCMDAYRGTLIARLNEGLQKNPLGKCFSIGSVALSRRGGALRLSADDVSVDYPALLDSEPARGVLSGAAPLLKAGASIFQKQFERLGIEALRQEPMKQKVLEVLQSTLSDKGIFLTLSDVTIVQTSAPAGALLAETPAGRELLDGESEAVLVRALAGYLRRTVQ